MSESFENWLQWKFKYFWTDWYFITLCKYWLYRINIDFKAKKHFLDSASHNSKKKIGFMIENELQMNQPRITKSYVLIFFPSPGIEKMRNDAFSEFFIIIYNVYYFQITTCQQKRHVIKFIMLFIKLFLYLVYIIFFTYNLTQWWIYKKDKPDVLMYLMYLMFPLWYKLEIYTLFN